MYRRRAPSQKSIGPRVTLLSIAANGDVNEYSSTSRVNESSHIDRDEMGVAAKRKLAVLEDIILTVGCTLDVDNVLERIVEITAAATEASGCFIYLYDEDSNELVLSAATKGPAYSHRRRHRLSLERGVTGWVATTRAPYIVPENLRSDPHFLYTPKLGERDYHSMFAVPIISRTDRLVGVCSLYASSPRHFTSDHVRMCTRIASLVATALENAQLYEAVNRRAYVLDRLCDLSATAISRLSLRKIIEAVTALAREVTASDFTVMGTLNLAGTAQFVVQSSGGSDSSVPDTVERIQGARRQLADIHQKIRSGDTQWVDSAELVRQDLSRYFCESISFAMTVGNERLGFLQCYRTVARRFTKEDQVLLQTIANQVALVIKQARLIEELERRDELLRFFRDIEAGRVIHAEILRRTARLGFDPQQPHLFVVLEIEAEGDSQSVARNIAAIEKDLSSTLCTHIPGVLYATAGEEIIALVPAASSGAVGYLKRLLIEVLERVRARSEGVLIGGIARPTSSLDDYPAALAEAREAISVGGKTCGSGGIFAFEDIAQHVYLSALTSTQLLVREPYREAIARIAEYDERRGACLLHTLEIYLELAGNQKRVADEIYVHRNTLRQRLDKIEELAKVELADRKQWFPLQLALKIHKFASSSPQRSSH